MNKNLISKRIRIARSMQEPKMDQKDLLAKLQVEGINISQSMLSKIENGKRPVSDIELKAFAKVLGVNIYWLLGETDSLDKNL